MVLASPKFQWCAIMGGYVLRRDSDGYGVAEVQVDDAGEWHWRDFINRVASPPFATADFAKAACESQLNAIIESNNLEQALKTARSFEWKVIPNQVINGVGPDAPIVESANGGKQSSCPYRADLLPPKACLEISKVLKHGADKYGVDNWRKISRADNLNHAMVHILAYLAGDRSDEHLSHAGCRILFAMETE